MPSASPKKCRHCSLPGKLRRLNLCYGCYHEPGVREQYPATSVMANRGHGLTKAKKDDTAEIQLAMWPCLHHYGSDQRIQVMILRAKYKLPTKHPGDAGGIRRDSWADEDDDNLFS